MLTACKMRIWSAICGEDYSRFQIGSSNHHELQNPSRKSIARRSRDDLSCFSHRYLLFLVAKFGNIQNIISSLR